MTKDLFVRKCRNVAKIAIILAAVILSQNLAVVLAELPTRIELGTTAHAAHSSSGGD